MNVDDFEERLRKQAMRQVPASWREEILSVSTRRSNEAKGLDSPSGLAAARLTTWWRELLGPCPQAWAALAAAWVMIVGIHVFTPETSEIVEARSPRVTAELLVAVNERRSLLAELMAPLPTEPPKAVPPKRRSERRVTVVAV